jgi:RNA polymerase sigma factor (sigma-70 family)
MGWNYYDGQNTSDMRTQMAGNRFGAVLAQIGYISASTGGDASDAELLRRFADWRDETAFAALVQRYGRLVWAVSRRCLVHEQDAEDAFQATFLILARGATAIRRPDALAGWLQGVAYRVAMRARRADAVRRTHERRRAKMAESSQSNGADVREVFALIDEELQRLPDRPRTAFTLRHLEGLSQAAAAARLGCTEGALAVMLTRARRQLRKQLEQRGIKFPAALAAAALVQSPGATAAPTSLVWSTVRTISHDAAGLVPARILALAQEISMFWRTKIIAGALLATLAASAFAGLVATGAMPPSPPTRANPVTPNVLAAAPEGPIHVFRSHTRPVTAVAFAPNATVLATGSHDKTIRLWNARSGREICTLCGHTGGVLSIAFSPDGALLASGGGDHTVRLWDVDTRRERVCLTGHKNLVLAVSFSQDGRSVASASADETVRLWDVAAGRESGVLKGHPSLVRAVAFTPDGQSLLSAGNIAPDGGGGGFRVWDAATGGERSVPLVGALRGAGAMALAPDGKAVAVAMTDPATNRQVIRILEVVTGRVRAELADADGVQNLVFAPDARTLAVGLGRGIRLWDVGTGRATSLHDMGRGSFHRAAFSPDGGIVAAGDAAGAVRVWDVRPALQRLQPAGVPITSSELEATWTELASDDAQKVNRAIGVLARFPEQAAPFLAERLLECRSTPLPVADPARVAKLIAALDHDHFGDREAAEAELAQLGARAETSLRNALATGLSAEATKRLDRLLGRLNRTTPQPEFLRAVRAIEALEAAGTADARQALRTVVVAQLNPAIQADAAAALKRLSRQTAVSAVDSVQDVPSQDVPSQDVRIGTDETKRYFLIGASKGAKAPDPAYGLIVILPGGDGSVKFHSFVKHIYKHAVPEGYIVAQPVAVKWSDEDVTWPTGKNRVEGMKFTTEEFVESVINDVAARHNIDRSKIFTLSWSSGGPAAYAVSLTSVKVKGSFIAMSVFDPEWLPDLAGAKGHAYYLYHSPGDRLCPYRMAAQAEKDLTRAGARVKFVAYEGGHGWGRLPYVSIKAGLKWLESNRTGAAAHE